MCHCMVKLSNTLTSGQLLRCFGGPIILLLFNEDNLIG